MIQITIPEEELELIYGSLKQALTRIQAEYPDVTWKLVYNNPGFFDTVTEAIHGEFADVIFQLPCEVVLAEWRLNGITKFQIKTE